MRTQLTILDKKIADDQPTFIVAEIGLNHNGDVDMAMELVKLAKECGADAVKFQKRDLKTIYKQDVYADPNKDGQSTQYLMDIFKKTELSKAQLSKIKSYCEKLEILFFCTPFDTTSADILDELDVSLYKISSADLTNTALLEHVLHKKKPVILSTGMSQMLEIDLAVDLFKRRNAPFALLHCVSTYPVAFKDVNLRMIQVLKKRYRVPVGYSGHERGVVVSVCAVAMGANIIEKHFTLDRSLQGPDHNISLTPEGFSKMVDRIRVAEMARGTGKKIVSRGELLSKEVFGKSIVASHDIQKGTTITKKDLEFRSPGKGLSPQLADSIIGKTMKRDITKHDYFISSDLL